MGIMTYETSDSMKDYSATQIKRFGEGQRVYRIVNATIFDSTRGGDKNCGLRQAGILQRWFFNGGPHNSRFDVEFEGNVVCYKVWEELNGTLDTLPISRKTGIKIGPYETLIIYPSNWLDLNNAEVIVEGGADTDPTLPLIGIVGAATVVLWFMITRRRRDRP